MKTLALIALTLVAACGSDAKKTPDAPMGPQMLTVKGTTKDANPLSPKMLAGVVVAAFKPDDTMQAMATSDASGNYTLTVQTNGAALDGYLKATFAGYLDTYLYPPKAITADFNGASMNLVTQGTVDLLSSTVCHQAQDTAKGLIGVMVIDAAGMPVAGATVSSQPAAQKYCYDMGGTPNANATVTDTDGLAYMINVTGSATVSAMLSGKTFVSHQLKAAAGALTTTQISE